MSDAEQSGGVLDRVRRAVSVDVGPSVETDLGVGETLGLLENRRRRLLADLLVGRGGEVGLGDAAEHIAARELDKPLDAVTAKERKRVYVSLRQSAAPVLDEAGVLVLHPGSKGGDVAAVAPGPELPAAHRALQAVRGVVGGGAA